MTIPKHTKLLLDSTHFSDIRSTVSSRSVAWDALARSAEINETDATVAKKLESALIKHTGVQISPAECVPSAIHIIETVHNAEVKKFVDNLLAELLSSDQYADATFEYFMKNPQAVFDLFNASLSGDDQTILLSSFNLVSLLIQPGLRNPDLVALLLQHQRFIAVLQNTDHMDTSYVCIRLLQELSALQEYRHIVWTSQAQFMPTLLGVLSKAVEASSATRVVPTNSNNLGVQVQYYSLLTLWLLTFDHQIASDFVVKYLSDFLNLLKLVKITIKEKLSRLCIAIILNCVAPHVKGHKSSIRQLLLLGNALPILQSLSERKYSDDELRQDLNTLKELLEETYQELTSFDEYEAEVNSKLLVWSPPHVDNGFWSDNIDKFKEQDWKLFKKLVAILASPNNELSTKTAIQVALSDITHVVELLPESVDVLAKLNGKVLIMELLNHPDSKVKYEALKATQAFVAHTFSR
ncbi:LANO_0G07206g1_1 [Lachancea nothofagi CBS 11611]|uniref:V-type proton ATPase subunit H n=1 Tax=Lachancea nothofagi CBS 11611 TaxID=1266666 RepID=A0A1G4KHH6_9SACH|nr:LANO_0G07206g1_1 [Lachancea nothofagi CBS 11611]